MWAFRGGLCSAPGLTCRRPIRPRARVSSRARAKCPRLRTPELQILTAKKGGAARRTFQDRVRTATHPRIVLRRSGHEKFLSNQAGLDGALGIMETISPQHRFF